MRVLLGHNYYRQPGGEDAVMEGERALLKAAGHRVSTYLRHNEEIEHLGPGGKALVPLQTLWARGSARELGDILRREKPDVAHFHNTFPLISPSAYYACHEAGVPVVQSLHNPRLLCPAATFYRAGRTCEACLGKALPWPAVLHACYRGSRVGSATVAAMLFMHRSLRTWQEQVDCYIVFTEFYRRKFIEGGLPAGKIAVKPHFVTPDPGCKDGPGSYALFIGRLSPEKGVETLLEAWERLKNVPLKIRGEGPLLELVRRLADRERSVELLPRLAREDLAKLIQGARFLVHPSEGLYETFGRVTVEAFACGVPVIASRGGVTDEIVSDGRTGLLFNPGDPDDLSAKLEWAWAHPNRMAEMGRAARVEYVTKYAAKRNYDLLMDIYERAIRIRKAA